MNDISLHSLVIFPSLNTYITMGPTKGNMVIDTYPPLPIAPSKEFDKSKKITTKASYNHQYDIIIGSKKIFV